MSNSAPKRSTTNYRTTEWSVRRLYNESDFKARFEGGEFQEYYDIDKVLSNKEVRIIHDAIPGTRRQYILCLENGDVVLEIHRYLRPDGKFAASGKNDPKTITINGITYGRSRANNPQPALTNRQINHILHKRGLAAILTYYYWLNHQTRRAWKWLMTARTLAGVL